MVDILFVEAILYQTLKLVPAILFASLGELVAEKSGVLNLGVEGLMLMAAFTAFDVTYMTGNPWLGILAAMGVSVLLSLMFSVFAINLRVNQVVIGLGLWLFGLGLSDTLYRSFFAIGTTPTVPIIGDISIPYLTSIPVIGRLLFGQNPLVYISLASRSSSRHLPWQNESGNEDHGGGRASQGC